MELSRLARLKSLPYRVALACVAAGLIIWPAVVGACENAEGSSVSLQTGGFVTSPITLSEGATDFPEVLFIEATGSSANKATFASVDVELASQSDETIIQLGNFAVLPG